MEPPPFQPILIEYLHPYLLCALEVLLNMTGKANLRFQCDVILRETWNKDLRLIFFPKLKLLIFHQSKENEPQM